MNACFAPLLRTGVGVLSVLSLVSAAPADFIAFGDFDPGTPLTSVSTWDSATHSLNQWYHGSNFYTVDPDGYARPDVATAASRKLMQVIASPGPGDYDFSFRYRLTDASNQYSVLRVYGLTDDGATGFTVEMNTWSPSITGAAGTVLYDQGGYESYLPSAADWTTITQRLQVGQYDYVAVYAVFSYDGAHGPGSGEHADLDDVELTPEPSSLSLLALAGLGLVWRRRAASRRT